MKSTYIGMRILAALLILITTPFYFTIGAMSLMAFSAPGPSLAPWLISGAVISNCLLIVFGSSVGTWKLTKHGKYGLGVLVSTIPLIGLGLFWLWLRTQSFT